MDIPFQLSFHGISPSAPVTDYVRKRAQKLITFADRVRICRVAIEAPHRHKREGRPYRVRIEVSVPGKEVVVSRDVGGYAQTDLYATIDAAFDDAQRRVQDQARRLRGKVKRHDRSRRGVVSKLYGYEGYGFIETSDGEEIYFQRNSVLNRGFDRMKRGAKVRFTDVTGEDGVHASTVVVTRGAAP
jgi:cold shock CspA family protein